MKKSSCFTGPTIRWGCALAWTAIVVAVLLKPADKLVIHELSFGNFLTSFFSLSFGAWDIIEAIYHIIVFAILTAFWYWVLVVYLTRHLAVLLVIGIAASFGIVTEIGQYFIHRNSLFLDAIANFLGVALCVVWLRCSRHK